MLRKVSDLENRLARPEAPLLTESAVRRSHLGSPLRGAAEYTDEQAKRQAYFERFFHFFAKKGQKGVFWGTFEGFFRRSRTKTGTEVPVFPKKS